jgi:hypothetical protein
MTAFDERFEDILKDISGDHKRAFVVRLLMAYKANEVNNLLNCKSFIEDSFGKLLMDQIVEEQKNSITKLEPFSANLPIQLKENFVELSEIIIGQGSGNGPGLVKFAEQNHTESAKESLKSDNFNSGKLDLIYLENSMEWNAASIRLLNKFLDCTDHQECREILEELISKDKKCQELLVRNYEELQNNGKWLKED